MPGLALLTLRLTLGTTAIIQGIAYLPDHNDTPFFISAIAFCAVFCGVFLLLGLMTRIAALVSFFGGLGTAATIIPAANYNLLAPALSAVYVGVTAVAVVLLGPGAFSLDALMFGRREITIPGKSSPPEI